MSRHVAAAESPKIGRILVLALQRTHPRWLARNPVMFLVAVGTILTFVETVRLASAGEPWGYELAISLLLAATVLFATGAEAWAESRGQAQADTLRAARTDVFARRLVHGDLTEKIPATQLRKGQLFVVEAGEVVPADGEIVEGAASIDESAITGESAPVLREAGTDTSGVTGGTTVRSDRIVVKVTADPGETFLDRMIAMVEGANRQRTPNEIALAILLAALTLVFLIVCAALPAMAGFLGITIDLTTLIALFVCLIPTTIGGLLPAIGIAGMDRALRAHIVAKSGRAVEVAGDVDTLLLDKTGTITVGARQATVFKAAPGVDPVRLRVAAGVSSIADPTPEGKSIVALARQQGATVGDALPDGTEVHAFSASTRMSGVDLPDGRKLRKGAGSRIQVWVEELGGAFPAQVKADIDEIARGGGTPLVVSEDDRVLGVVGLTDIIKPGIKERFAQLRVMGIKTVMITGDNPLTAAAIAAEAGVDGWMAEATPEDKLTRIRQEQAEGRLVAMMGDGTNDAPALAQADVGVAMNAGTQAAKEAANMIDLDSDPTKLLEVVNIGKQLLLTRGSLTTFSLANDVAKYFAILPAIFVASLPGLEVLDVMDLASPRSAILSAVIFNALIIPALVPLALRGVPWRPLSASALLVRNVLIYGVGGVIAPFVGIKAIDLLLTAAGVA